MRYIVAFIVGLAIGGLCFIIPGSIHRLLHPIAILYPLPTLAAHKGYENLAITIALFQAPFYTFFYTLGKTNKTKMLLLLAIVFVHIMAAAFVIHYNMIVYGLFWQN